MDLVKDKIENWYNLGNSDFNSQLNRIKKSKESGKSILLFGAGEAGKLVKKILDDRGISVDFFADNSSSKWGTAEEGVPIIGPAQIKELPNLFIIICCWDIKGVVKQLQKLDMAKTNIDINFYIACSARRDRDFYLRHIPEIVALEKILSDERSKEVLRALLRHSLTLDGQLLNDICEPDQYFFDQRFFIKSDDVVVDAGAFTGDTVNYILSRFGKNFKEIHCFEPNRKNYLTLNRFIQDRKLQDRVIPHQLGLSDQKGILNFSGSDSGFHFSAGGEIAEENIKVDTIDSLFKDIKVDFIKMDIEGAEPKALRGGAAVIKRDRPRLAICVYHEPEQLWEIPTLIHSLVPEYKLFLRHHTEQRLETVIYATI